MTRRLGYCLLAVPGGAHARRAAAGDAVAGRATGLCLVGHRADRQRRRCRRESRRQSGLHRLARTRADDQRDDHGAGALVPGDRPVRQRASPRRLRRAPRAHLRVAGHQVGPGRGAHRGAGARGPSGLSLAGHRARLQARDARSGRRRGTRADSQGPRRGHRPHAPGLAHGRAAVHRAVLPGLSRAGERVRPAHPHGVAGDAGGLRRRPSARATRCRWRRLPRLSHSWRTPEGRTGRCLLAADARRPPPWRHRAVHSRGAAWRGDAGDHQLLEGPRRGVRVVHQRRLHPRAARSEGRQADRLPRACAICSEAAAR